MKPNFECLNQEPQDFLSQKCCQWLKVLNEARELITNVSIESSFKDFEQQVNWNNKKSLFQNRMTEEKKKSSDLIAEIEENFKEIVDQKNLESSAKLYNNVDSEMKNTLQIFDNFINELVWDSKKSEEDYERDLNLSFDDDIEETETSLKNELEMTMKDDFELYKCEKNKLATMQDDHTRNMKELSDKNNIELQLSFGENENQLKANRTKFILENHQTQKELSVLKASNLISKEKVDYDFEILKKKEEENARTISDQKRRINKLQDTLATQKNILNEKTDAENVKSKNLKKDVENLIEKIEVQRMRSKELIIKDVAEQKSMQKVYVEQCEKSLAKMKNVAGALNAQNFLERPDEVLRKIEIFDNSQNSPQCTGEIIKIDRENRSRPELYAVLKCISENCDFLLGADSEEVMSKNLNQNDSRTIVKACAILNILGIKSEKNLNNFLTRVFKSYLKCGGKSAEINSGNVLPHLKNCLQSFRTEEANKVNCSGKSENSRSDNQSTHDYNGILNNIELYLKQFESSDYADFKEQLGIKEKALKSCFEISNDCDYLDSENRKLNNLLKNYLSSKRSEELEVAPAAQ